MTLSSFFLWQKKHCSREKEKKQSFICLDLTKRKRPWFIIAIDKKMGTVKMWGAGPQLALKQIHYKIRLVHLPANSFSPHWWDRDLWICHMSWQGRCNWWLCLQEVQIPSMGHSKYPPTNWPKTSYLSHGACEEEFWWVNLSL